MGRVHKEALWDRDKAVIITNNDWVCEKYKVMIEIIYVETYEEVLIKTRDMVHDRHHLLTHPQASSLKPNQTPYRSVIVYPNDEDDMDDNMSDILLIEKCLEVFYQWQKIAPTPREYTDRVKRDFKVIDASMIDSVIPRIFD